MRTPKLNMSLRSSSGIPLICSGDIYAGVPITTPGCVSTMVNRGEPGGRSKSLAKPKSITFATIRSDHYVLRLNVAMYYSSLMGARECARHLDGYIYRVPGYHSALRHSSLQSFTLDKFSGNEMHGFELADFENGENVGMIQC